MQLIDTSRFERSADVPVLADDEIHLWLLHAPAPLSSRALAPLAHAHLGQLLQGYAGVPVAPAIARGEHGKPYVVDPGFPQFNLSHAGACVALVFAHGQAVGVDIESVQRRRSSLELARRFFAVEEAQALGALDPALRDAAFVRLWTCKEAVLKALGRGLAFGLDRLRFGLDAAAMPTALESIGSDGGRIDDWQMLRFEPDAAHVGALAWAGANRRIRAFRGSLAG